ncbi:MAG: stage II sporulation protein M [Pirellulaceae bacterium]
MNIVTLLEQRRKQWDELETLCRQFEKLGKRRQMASSVTRFAALYRSVCADLALAEAYQLPPSTVEYLHRLVGRSHNQMYRSRSFSLDRTVDMLVRQAPQQIFNDPCVRVCALLFFGLFWLSMILAVSEDRLPNFPARVVGEAQLDQLESSFDQEISAGFEHYMMMSSFYIRHNTGIGLKCFAYGILIIPCIFTLAYNAVALGTMFGFMARDSSNGGENFFEFVTAHGPFELTAIALSAAAGLRLGIGLIATAGLRRGDSLKTNALLAVPVISAAAVLFFLAALTEGFLSPSPAPYTIKAIWAILSSGAMTFYFVVLGFPRSGIDAI